MNKKRISIFVLLVFGAIFAVQAVALDAVVENVQGKVEVKVNNKWQAVSNGDKVDTGAMISTAFKSSCDLKIGASKVTVKPLTRVKIASITPGADRDDSEVFLDTGSIIADVKPLENKRVGFTVKSPAATASVRGTSGIVDAYGSVSGFSGTWYVSDNNGSKGFEVKPNQTVTFTESSTVVTPQEKDDESATIATIKTLADEESGKADTVGNVLTSSVAPNVAEEMGSLSIIIDFTDM